MFTGIITDIGIVSQVEMRGDMRARISCNYDMSGVDLGASIACDGVCLTVVDKGADWFDVDISAETLSRTNIGANGWAGGRRLNLERALRVGDELGGHIVSGHVDGVARIEAMQDEGDSTRMTFSAPPALARFIATKGSVALNGTSLTVNEVDGNRFGVNIIPHTQAVTTWGEARVGDLVNLEIDTLARYVARLAETG
ncbi:MULTISPECIES: riboflavin synthase [unclassified Paracoccus (in: a-proteobacteria)]|uniref:riboflavin synthase n=1 Tax=unclassified Paracoccus (in: a-proteobacteria) TaxID=2688777 RepID=UPI0012B34854|nr:MULTISPECIES: riboflavin synthase [unclassified Paracoccus (in: a-proteobacteria)]UXU74514.1 riboflavin synthase [Paracoccus sp. SMMA_5]UXU80407.1 riboflavin synthase [Paracoccus sp. SMMA_5_TC]